MKTLYSEIKRATMPHNYHVSGSEEYVNFKNEMIKKTKEKVKVCEMKK